MRAGPSAPVTVHCLKRLICIISYFMGSSFQYRAFEEQIQTTASESPLFPRFWEYLLDIPIKDIIFYTYQSQFLLPSKHLGQDLSTLTPLLHEINWSPVMRVLWQDLISSLRKRWSSDEGVEAARPILILFTLQLTVELAWLGPRGHHSRKVDDGTLTGVSSKPNATGKGKFPKENYSPVLPKGKMDADWWKVLSS